MEAEQELPTRSSNGAAAANDESPLLRRIPVQMGIVKINAIAVGSKLASRYTTRLTIVPALCSVMDNIWFDDYHSNSSTTYQFNRASLDRRRTMYKSNLNDLQDDLQRLEDKRNSERQRPEDKRDSERHRLEDKRDRDLQMFQINRLLETKIGSEKKKKGAKKSGYNHEEEEGRGEIRKGEARDRGEMQRRKATGRYQLRYGNEKEKGWNPLERT